MILDRLFIQSCHAALESDHCRTFQRLGLQIGGDWDIGSKERPKIAGVTDHNSSVSSYDLVILHQTPNYPKDMENLLRLGKRVVLVSFGQADTWQFEAIGKLCRDFPHAWVAPYSKTDTAKHLQYGAPPHKVRMIRFGKELSDFHPWQGNGGYIYAACNSVHKRGGGCGWVILEQVMKRLPILLSGFATEEVGGLGQVSEPKMREIYRDAAAFISFGTKPAPMVLTQLESFCAGCPTIIWDNECGIANEGFESILTTDVEKLCEEGDKMLENPDYRQEQHLAALRNAQQFDNEQISKQWKEFLMEVCK